MGIPKFFRFTSERYPCISEPIHKDTYLCDFDNLYLDMNGIIHMCSHPDDSKVHARIDEEKLYRDIFHYISYLFQLINPKKLFYMAVDGVAPRAKMNHQRSRRFQSAREGEEQLKKAIENGDVISNFKRFDSNCITPGTVFMTRLDQQLQYFVKQKISTDRNWARCQIVLSGHQTPGEGEHKIMDYIRYLRAQPDHNPNTRHCLYGQDADLILLGFCSHEPNFSILREEVVFSKTAPRPTTPDENNFYLLHLSLLRDYLEQEFLELKSTLSFPYDIYKIIDDWVLMTFLVGNDFVPNLPNLLINKNALPMIYDIYKKVLPTLDGYINDSGKLNLARFETFMMSLSELDLDKFQEQYSDLKYLDSKTGKKTEWMNEEKVNDLLVNLNIVEVPKKSAYKSELDKLISATDELAMDSDEDSNGVAIEEDFDSEEAFVNEFLLHKKNYYMSKMELNVTSDMLKSQAEGYVKAIQWILNYYYQGCCSWSWFYPHHYAPYLSDIRGFKDMEIEFDQGTPFKPFEQLLSVLPVASKDLLPLAFQSLMTDENSPIYEYYPLQFETDLNGKLQQWEAVVLLPFIDQETLLNAMEPCYEFLTDEEKKRNIHNPMLLYEFSEKNLGELFSPSYFPPLKENHALEIPVCSNDVFVPEDLVVRGLLPNPYINTYFPGLPTLKHLPFTCEFKQNRVKIFESPSRNLNAILQIDSLTINQSLQSIAAEILGKVVWVGWPYIVEAKVMEISNENETISYVPKEKKYFLEDDDIKLITTNTSEANKSRFVSDSRHFVMHNMSRLGIDVGEIKVMVYASLIQGYKYVTTQEGKLVCGVEWCSTHSFYPLQTILRHVEISPAGSPKKYQSLEEAFPKGEIVYILTGSYYGSKTEITDTSKVSSTGRISVRMFYEPEPDIPIPKHSAVDNYIPAKLAAGRCGISVLLFSRITSSLFITPKSEESDSKKYKRNVNIGLIMKSPKSNEEMLGFTHRINNKWAYSMRCVQLVTDYVCSFPELFNKLEMYIENENLLERHLFDEEGYITLKDVEEWLKQSSHFKYPLRPCGTRGLEPEELESLRCYISSSQKEIREKSKEHSIQVKPHVIFKEDLRKGNIPPDLSNTEFDLYDRVVNISSSCSVPLGYKGTVVSIMYKSKQDPIKFSDNINNTPMYLVLFDAPFHSAMKIEGVQENCCYLMHGFNMLNITSGQRNHAKNFNKVQLIKSQQYTRSSKSSSENHNSAFAQYSNPGKVAEGLMPKFNNPMNHQVKHPYPPQPLIMQPNLMPFQQPLLQPKQQPYNNFMPVFNKPTDTVQKDPMVNMIVNNQDNSQSTQFLKSLLKINQNTPNNHSSFFNNGSNNNFIASPSQFSIPFPGKLIEAQNTKPVNNSKVVEESKPFMISTPFIPPQVTIKSIIPNTSYQVKEKDNNVVTSNDPLLPPTLSCSTQVQDIVEKEEKSAIKRNRRSRMAAKFSNTDS